MPWLCYQTGMRSLLTLLAVFLALTCGTGPSLADQANPTPEEKAATLDKLFAELRDPNIGAEVMNVESKIWANWMYHGNNSDNMALAHATLSMNNADFPAAEKQLNDMLAKNRDYAEVWNKRATLYFMMGRYEESLVDIVKTLDLEPRHFGALSGRGMIYQRLGRNAEALKAYKEALAIHPHLVGARLAVQQLEKLVPEL